MTEVIVIGTVVWIAFLFYLVVDPLRWYWTRRRHTRGRELEITPQGKVRVGK